MRVTLGDIKNPALSRIPQALGICATDARLVAWLNEGTQRLLWKGKWWGSCGKYNICASGGCITLPRQIAAIESVAICRQPVRVVDFWFEFLDSGAGTIGPQNCYPQAVMRGRHCVFTDITGTDKKLIFLCDVVQDVGKTVLCLGYDQNGNWIRTMQGGAWADGELITLSQSPGTTSVNLFTSITDIQFTSSMQGQSWLYSVSQTDGSKLMLGHYQYNEPRPSYARYFFPTLQNCQSQNSCGQQLVEIMAKHEFIPVVNDTDYLILGNIPALKEICLALQSAENEPDNLKKNSIIASGEGLAMAELDSELDHYLGSGRRIGIEMLGSSVGDLQPVETFI